MSLTRYHLILAASSKSTSPGNRTPPNCFEDSHASTTLERHIFFSIRRSEVGIRKFKFKSSELRLPNSDFKKEGRVGIEPTRGCLTGTFSTTELPTLGFKFGGFPIRRSEVGIRKFIFGSSDFRFPIADLPQSGTPESNREPQASKAHVLPSAPVPVCLFLSQSSGRRIRTVKACFKGKPPAPVDPQMTFLNTCPQTSSNN